MIAFNHESTATVNTNNSPVSSILFDNSSTPASPTSSQVYAGDAAVSAGTVTVTWTTSSGSTDLYSNPVIFESTVVPSSGYVSKIKVGSAYKNITAGFVATSSGWKELVSGKIAQGRGSMTTSWKTVFKNGKE